MNLNNIEKEEKKEEVQKRSTGEEMDLLFSLGVENPWWDRKEPLDHVDVTKIQMRESEFAGEKRKDKDGNQIYEIALTMIDSDDLPHYVSFTRTSNMFKAFRTALKEEEEKWFAGILGKCVSLECTGKNGLAYTYKASIHSDGNHEVEGYFNIDGDRVDAPKKGGK